MKFRSFAVTALILGSTCLAHATSIVVNGSFEQLGAGQTIDPSIKWNTFTQIPGWQLSSGPHIEIQQNGLYTANSKAADGINWVELDGDNTGPGQPNQGQSGSSTIYQDLATIAGSLYQITFALSARPGILDNQLQVMWGNTSLTPSVLTVSGLGLTDPTWTYYTYTALASGSSTRLSFHNTDKDDSFGTLIDDVSASQVPEPASLMLLGSSLLGVFRARRKA